MSAEMEWRQWRTDFGRLSGTVYCIVLLYYCTTVALVDLSSTILYIILMVECFGDPRNFLSEGAVCFCCYIITAQYSS